MVTLKYDWVTVTSSSYPIGGVDLYIPVTSIFRISLILGKIVISPVKIPVQFDITCQLISPPKVYVEIKVSLISPLNKV